MYSLKKAFTFDINAEIAAMAEFLATRWERVEKVEVLLRLIAEIAETNSRSAIVDHEITLYTMEQRKKREKILKAVDESGGSLSFYDQVYVLLEGIDRQVYKVYSHGNDALYNVYDAAMKVFKKALAKPELVHLKKAAPIGLAEMTKHYREHDAAWESALEQEFDDRKAFKGADTAGASQGGFVSAVNLTMVVQVKDTHNTAPIDQLIRGAYDHFVNVHRAVNSQAVVADLKQLSSQINKKRGLFSVDFEPKHKLTKVLYALAQEGHRRLSAENPEQAYLEAVAARKDAVPLSEDELNARRAEAAGMLSQMLKDMRKPETPKQARVREAERERERQAVSSILKSL